MQSAGPQKEAKRDKKAKGKKKKVFDSTQSSNPKLKYRQKDRVSASLAEQTHKQKEPTIVTFVEDVGKKPVKLELREESGELREELGERPVELGEESGGDLREELVSASGSFVGALDGGDGRTSEQVGGGLEAARQREGGSGFTAEVGVPEQTLATSGDVAGTSGGVVGTSGSVVGVFGDVAGDTVSAAAAESDEEEKAALLGEENIRQMEEAEKVRDGWVLVLMPDPLSLQEQLTILDALTGCPMAEDLLLYAIPVCGPYSAMLNYKSVPVATS